MIFGSRVPIVFFFFYNDIDTRRSSTKKVQPLVVGGGSLYFEIRRNLGFGSVLKVFVDVCLMASFINIELPSAREDPGVALEMCSIKKMRG